MSAFGGKADIDRNRLVEASTLSLQPAKLGAPFVAVQRIGWSRSAGGGIALREHDARCRQLAKYISMATTPL